MDAVERASRRRTLETPSKPESGLAEWTSKIKALQRQVDEDEEAEHKRLEEEIAASRLARMRRSTGGGSRGSSLDLSKTDVAVSLKNMDSSSPTDTNRTRQQNQEEAMKKLSGQYIPPRAHPVIQPSTAPPSGTSLAAFMGSKAIGPRLTRHAPQQNAHDPTQFEQRSHVAAPHPVFGRGGIAMPGMTTDIGRNLPSFSHSIETRAQTSRADTESLAHRDRTISTPTVKPIIPKFEERRTTTPQKIEPAHDTGLSARQRTISTPTGLATQRSSINPVAPTAFGDSQSTKYVSRPGSRSPAASDIGGPTQMTAHHDRQNILDKSLSPQPHSTPLSRSPSIPPPSPRHSSPSFKSQVSTPSLSRAIQPQPRPSFSGPQLSAPSPSSAAFLRPPAEKEPTPSISRLQGRGFVQSVVKASSQLSSAPTGSESPVPRHMGGTPENGRKASVLERWQFEGGTGGSNTPPPIISPKPVPMRKTRTLDPVHSFSTSSSPVPTPFHADSSGRSLKTVPSLPSIVSPKTPDLTAIRPSSSRSDVGAITPSPRPKTPAGSSSTLISYLKPMKTGDSPPSSSSPSTPVPPQSKVSLPPAVDELGVRIRPRSKSITASASGETVHGPVRAPSANGDREEGKPLSHPTKDRAKKPRKARETAKEVHVGSSSRDQSTVVATAHVEQPSRSGPITMTSASSSRVQSDTAQEHSSNPSPNVTVKSSVSVSPLPGSPTPPHDRMPPHEASHVLHSIVVPSSNQIPQVEFSAPSSKHKKHHRIPSTGNRATVMDVAQALEQHEKHVRDLSEEPVSNNEVALSAQETDAVKNSLPDSGVRGVSDKPATQRNGAISPARMEQRKSSYEKYSAFVMPPLAEEATPVQSPAGTLARNAIQSDATVLDSFGEESYLEPGVVVDPPVYADPDNIRPNKSVFHISSSDNGPLPPVDMRVLLRPEVSKENVDAQSISVDVLSVFGSTTSTINVDQHIFYDRELLLVVHRSKTKSSGLVSTTVWSWCGKRNEHGEREERKLHEVAKHYNTTLISVKQYAEPIELVTILGGLLSIRQGTRARWSKENTTMHIVRSRDSVIFIDEVELGERNLCSGFSYCVSLLETLYVWYGQGSVAAERKAALDYAKSLAATNASVIELIEGQNDDDEMFWMMMGEHEYAQADYWKWRCDLPDTSPRMWVLEDRTQPVTFHYVAALYTRTLPHDHVYIVDCVFEYFVLIGQDCRNSRKKIRLALSTASELSLRAQQLKPFVPPVHVVIFPSQIPEDLRLTFRDLDDFDSNQSPYPDHMNLLSADDARKQLQQTSWERDLLKDTTMLPLGVHPSDL